MEEPGHEAMNLVGLILIATLSGGIVAISLRLRAPASSARLLTARDRLPAVDSYERAHPRQGHIVGWLQNPFGLKAEPRLYRSVKDQIGS